MAESVPERLAVCCHPRLIEELCVQDFIHAMAMRRMVLDGPERFPAALPAMLDAVIRVVMRQN